MGQRRFAKFLQKLSFSGAGHTYQALERSEEEALVSLGALQPPRQFPASGSERPGLAPLPAASSEAVCRPRQALVSAWSFALNPSSTAHF